MKTTILRQTILLATISIFAASLQLRATASTSSDPATITIHGIVKDATNNRTLEYVSISVAGTNKGTITNTNGIFTIKIIEEEINTPFEISHLGYKTKRVLPSQLTDGTTIYLEPQPDLLDEITIKAIDPRELVKQSIDKIEENYSSNSSMFRGFYRETIRKRRKYINISEAVVDILKKPYSEGYGREMVTLRKGRNLLSAKEEDTLMIKFLGGPNLILYLDLVKNPDLMFSDENLFKYKFSLEEIVMIEDKPHFVVHFSPLAIMPYALHFGKLYIDRSSYALSRAEINVDMTNRNKVTRALLRKKPLGMRFKPESISYLVTYKQSGDNKLLSYVRSETEFKCDWKRKLFSTNYTIVSETVITGQSPIPQEKLSHRDSFKDKFSLTEKAQAFYDKEYWEGYNIIAPEESLEKAVDRLIKNHR
jgi:hypothetical protein